MNEELEKFRKSVNNYDGPQKELLLEILECIKNTRINVLLIGGTGVGKSSTINALFHTSGAETKAVVGEGANPETMEISEYHLKNMVIWDTPGLGDSAEKDQQHQQKITELLCRNDSTGRPLIDLILLILDGTSRDFSSAYKLIKEVVKPNLSSGDEKRLLIGINKVDKVMHHKFWDSVTNQPKPELIKKLEEQSETVRKRIEEDTGFSPDVIYYAAGETYEGKLLQTPYNLAKMLSFIIDRLPGKKRASIVGDINNDKENFASNDNKENYQEKIEKSIIGSITEMLSDAVGQVRGIALGIIQKSDLKNIFISAAVGWINSAIKKK